MASLLSQQASVDIRGASGIALLHRLECKACPLNEMPDGKLEPTGSVHPMVYILGEAAGATEAEEREQFVGESGKLLRAYVPRTFKDKLRFNNCARSHPPKNATPDTTILECCRPSVQRDIERTKPPAIFGFGNVPLHWVSDFSGITLWRGRKMPVKVGNHTCWFFPMLHPAYLVRQRRGNGVPSEEERMFGFDMKRAFAQLADLPPPVVHTPADVRRGVEIITGERGDEDLGRLEEALRWAAKQKIIGVDYETNGLRPYIEGSKILSAAVATGDRAVAFAIDHPEAGWKGTHRDIVQALWKEFLAHAQGVKAVHNLAFEMEWTAYHFGPEFLRKGRWGDTMTQAGVIDERKGNKKAGPFSLEFLVQQYFGFNIKKLAGVDRANLVETPIEAVLQYNAPDARYHALLYQEQALLIEEEGLEVPYELGLRSVPTVVLTQRLGLPVDQKEVVRLKKKYEKAYDAIAAKLMQDPAVKEFEQRKNTKFEPLSNPNVIYVLKDILDRKEIYIEDKFSKKPKLSADESILEQINLPFAKNLIDLRKVNKKLSTYVIPLEEGNEKSLIYPDGLLHAQFNTVFAETARLSCDNPNLQNFPIREGEAKEVRKQIVAPPGCLIMAFDMGQIEARVISMITKDAKFTKALWENYDIHMEWAERLARAYPARVGGKQYLNDKKVMKTFRTDVKNQFTFPLFFGARLESASGYLGIPEENLKPVYDAFWREFSGVKDWQETLMQFYRENGYVECLTGRRRRGPLSVNQIYNSPVQGTAAAIVLEVMSRLSETEDPELQPEIQIHDDLTWARVPEKRVDVVAEKILDIMLKPVFPWINVPLTVEGKLGPNWLEMSEFGTFSSDGWGK